MRLSTGKTTNCTGDALAWARLKARDPRGLVFIPPLIGGSAGGPLRLFRWLSRFGFDLFSYDYSGHGRSGGTFSLGASLRDSRRMLRVAADQAAGEGLPLLGTAACYGAIPLVSGACRLGEPMKRMILINPLPDFGVGVMVSGFRRWRAERSTDAVTGPIGGSIKRYLDRLFPFTEKSMRGFGLLRRHRTRLVKTLLEAIHFAPLQTLQLRQTQVLCLYAQRDVIRQAAGYACDATYRRRIRAICPGALFYAIDDNHYLAREYSRREARAQIREFLMLSGG